ncbi:CHAP domain-containing protein [Tsuneonella amylolytica]|uniref:CHAP domain-containing protein n=1 Tax=Tsuneonella amylolytica TaxID=2338327 RepID=UPI000EAA3112|nr:CHAP domain-containing protein [Tsuneonella amylolytica]
MREGFITIAAACALACPGAALAAASEQFSFGDTAENRAELPPYLQCVPYARERSGVQIYGDAHTWWDQAAGRYARGNRPKAGAVMAFRSSGSMVLGHVAAVSRVVDSRTVLLDHANWSPINGRRGQIERGVRAIDVSPANDWSQVRVWYAPIGDLGTTVWPVAGFIYNDRARGGEVGGELGGARVLAAARYAPPPISAKPSKAFANAFAGLGEAPSARSVPSSASRLARVSAQRVAARIPAAPPRDPLDAAIARYNP